MRKPSVRVAVTAAFAVGLVAVIIFVVTAPSPPEPVRLGATPGASHEPARHGGAAGSRPPEATITLGPRRQRFLGWGGSVVSDTRVDPLASPGDNTQRLDDLVFRTAGVRFLRVWSPAYGFGAQDRRLSARDGRFALVRRARRYGVEAILTGADAAPAMKDGRALRPGAERRYARSLTDVLALARRVGASFRYVAVGNEVDNRASALTMSPSQAARVLRELARLIRARHLPTRLVLGDNTGWAQTLVYARAELAAVPRRSVGLIAAHAYSGSDADRRALRAFAARARLPVWMTEWTIGCPHGDCPDNPSVSFALARAREALRDVDVAGAQAWFLLRAVSDTTHGADEGLALRDLDSAAQPVRFGKRLAVFRQLAWAARPGSRVRIARVAGARLPALAFSEPGRIALVVVNPTAAPVRVGVDLGPRAGSLASRVTSADESFRSAPALNYRGRSVSTVPATSVVSYVLTPAP